MTRRNHLPDIEMCRPSSRPFHGENLSVKEIVIAKPASYRRRLVESGALILMGRGCQASRVGQTLLSGARQECLAHPQECLAHPSKGCPCLALRAIKAKGGICDAGRQALGYLYATNR